MSITLDGINGVTASSPATVKANAYLDASGGNTATINGAIPAPATSPTLTTPIISGNLGAGGANYGTSGQLLTSGGAGSSPSWASAALGSTTVTNKTGSRATATTYQNTTNGWLLVCFSMSNNGVTFLIGATSGLGITAMSSNFSGNVQTYLVPPGWYYRATGTVLSNWTEGQA